MIANPLLFGLGEEAQVVSCRTGSSATNRRSVSLFHSHPDGKDNRRPTPFPPSPVKVLCGSVGEVGDNGTYNSLNATPSHGRNSDVQSSRARTRALCYICAAPPGGRRPVSVTSLAGGREMQISLIGATEAQS